MAQYQNGQYYGYQQPAHGQYQQQQDPYAQRPPSFEQGDDNPYGVNGDQSQHYGYQQPALPGRSASNATRLNSELFMDPGSAPALPSRPAPQRATASYPSYSPPATYNPGDYASASPPIQQSPAAIARRPSYPNAAPAAYNPADYAESNLSRMGSTAGYQHGFSPGYPTTNTAAAPMPSPSLYQNAAARPQSTYSSRPTVQTAYTQSPSRSSNYAAPAPPPLPAIPGSAESPGADWGQVPTRYNSTHRRYGEDLTALGSAPLPPARQGSGRSSTGPAGHTQSPYSHSHSLPPTPGPPPPLHSGSNDTYQSNRPLPQLPSEPSSSHSDYPPRQGRNGYAGSAEAEQDNLEQQIMNLATNSPRVQVSCCRSARSLTFY